MREPKPMPGIMIEAQTVGVFLAVFVFGTLLVAWLAHPGWKFFEVATI